MSECDLTLEWFFVINKKKRKVMSKRPNIFTFRVAST
jgi:hypothetical protein